MPALFIVLGIAVVVFIAAAGHHKHPAHRESPRRRALVVELDRGMPPSVVDKVLTALGEESDPARLDALGGSLEMHYPLSASELRAKAAMLRTSGSGPAPLLVAAAAPASLPAAHEPAQAPAAEPAWPARAATAHELDVATVLQAAMRALVEETDPVVLDGFAESIRAPYPTAAEILASRAHALRASTAVGARPHRRARGSAEPRRRPASVPFRLAGGPVMIRSARHPASWRRARSACSSRARDAWPSPSSSRNRRSGRCTSSSRCDSPRNSSRLDRCSAVSSTASSTRRTASGTRPRLGNATTRGREHASRRRRRPPRPGSPCIHIVRDAAAAAAPDRTSSTWSTRTTEAHRGRLTRRHAGAPRRHRRRRTSSSGVVHAAEGGVEDARHAASALLTGGRVVAHVLDTPMRLAEHVPLVGGTLHELSPMKKLEQMTSAIQHGDFKEMKKIVTDEAHMVQGLASLVPGIGSGIGAALGTGLAVLDGGGPLDMAIHAAYGAIPIPAGNPQRHGHGARGGAQARAPRQHHRRRPGSGAQRAFPTALPRHVFDTTRAPGHQARARQEGRRGARRALRRSATRPVSSLPKGVAETVEHVVHAEGRAGGAAAEAIRLGASGGSPVRLLKGAETAAVSLGGRRSP